jgi:hypothetical protein
MDKPGPGFCTELIDPRVLGLEIVVAGWKDIVAASEHSRYNLAP